jgi:hypothetical protein
MRSFWVDIEAYLVEKGHDRDIFQDLLWFIEAPNTPSELPRILYNLFRLFSSIKQIIRHYPDDLIEIHPDEWIAICTSIADYPQISSLAASKKKKGKMPLRGFYDSNPVYIAIWERPVVTSAEDTYFLILAHVLVAIEALKERINNGSIQDDSDLKSNRLSALLAVRKLADYDNQSILEALTELQVGPEGILAILNGADELLTPLRVLFKYLLDLRKPPHREESEQARRRQQREGIPPAFSLPANISRAEANLDPDQEGRVATYDILNLPTCSENDQREAERSGCAATESSSGTEIVSSAKTCKGSERIKTAFQKTVVARTVKRQLAMLNQRLPARWEQLSLYEVSSFLSATSNLITSGSKSPYLPKHAEPKQLAALVTTMFWLGQRIERFNNLYLYQHGDKKFEDVTGFVRTSEGDGYWWIRPAVPSRTVQPDELQRSQAQLIDDAFPLCSGIRIETIIAEYVQRHLKSILPHGELFPFDLDQYENVVKDFLAIINQKHNTRLTMNRISDYLFDVIAGRDDADLVTAMYITGREHFLGRNPSYYTSLPIKRLQTIYQDVCLDIRDRHLVEQKRTLLSIVSEQEFQHAPGRYVGSPFRPTQKAVRNLVTTLKQHLKNAGEAELSVLKLMRLHNNMTRYTAFMIAFSTGFRAIRDPFLSSAEVDWRTGFAVLSDKDNEDQYNSRLIWLPPDCLAQLKLFREHQQNAGYRFHLLMPNLHDKLGRLRRNAPGRHMFFTSINSDRDGYMPITVGPKNIGFRLRDVYALPFNASRHYLRSTLLENNCPVEVINALMGHFERGEEPWGDYSGLSPHEYRNLLQEKLVPLLQEDGWEPLRGVGSAL